MLERDHAIDSMLDKATKTADVTTTFQTLLVNRTKNFLQHLSTFEEVLDPNSAICSEFLADIIKIKDIYINIGVPREDGELLCNVTPLDKKINVSDRPYIQQAIATRDFAISEFQIDRATGVTSLNFAYPVIHPDNDKVVGVAVAVLSLAWWSKQLAESQLPKGSVAYITDRQQKIIATSPPNKALLGMHLSEVKKDYQLYQSLLDQNQNQKQNQTSYLSTTVSPRVFYSKPLFDNRKDVTVSISIPLQEELSAIYSKLIFTAGILFSLMVIMLFVANWVIKKSVLKPLKSILQSTKELEKGEFKGELPLLGSSEFIDLQHRFTSMAKTRLNAQKKLEDSQKSLQVNRNLLMTHIENTPLGCISWDKDFICTSWNKAAEKIFGYSAEQAIGKHGSDLVITPKNKDQIQNIFQLLLRQQGGRTSTNENITQSGEIIICEWNNTLLMAEDGNISGVTSLVQDVTKDKLLNERLTLAASVFTHAREGIIITNAKVEIIEVNDTFIEITGYQREEVLGQNPNVLKSNQQAPEFYRNLWKTIQTKGHWSGEIWNKRKNNEIYAQLLTISAVQDDSGVVTNYVAIFTDISPLKEQQNKLQHMAHYDVLTDLPNRTLLADRLELGITHCDRHSKQLAVIFLDLDGFKEINDTYGHSLGDELLVEIAKRLQQPLRDCDTLARFGGDEFVVVLTNLSSPKDYQSIVKNLLKVAAEPITLGKNILSVSASIGITLYPTDNTNADQLVRHADQAMYIAKQKGKNCYHLFDLVSEDAIKNRHEILQQITLALENREFVLFYQPKVNMRTGEIIGVEALIRWQHPLRGLLSPFEFLPYIENHHLSIDIGEWVIEEALHQIQTWSDSGHQVPVSINISALQLLQQNFVHRLETILASCPATKPSMLQLELLETSELGDIIDASRIMQDCLKLGVSFAIDDFGTGYSSLTYLRYLPAGLLKIDQVFIRDMLLSSEDRAIVVGIIALSQSFERQVIAEGVETTAHGTALLKLGCELAQGYGIAKPMPAADYANWAANWAPPDEWRLIAPSRNIVEI